MMIRNLHAIVLVNVLMLAINFYLLTSTVNQPSEENDSETQVQEELGMGPRNQTTGSLPVVFRDLENVTNKQENINQNQSKPLLLDEPEPEIYRVVFYNQSSPIKNIHLNKNWSLQRKGYAVPSITRSTAKEVSCEALLSGSITEIQKAKEVMNQRQFTKVPLQEEAYLEWTQDCEKFKRTRGYVSVPLTIEEEAFPIAFSISMFTDVEQMERLLRAVYQPQNLYCVHVDVKSSLLIHRAVAAIVNCFDNVFLTSQISKVKWGDVSVLLPHLSCMRDLVKYFRGKWKYFIDLSGQEFPLRTNYEIVQILKIYNGSNDVTASHKK